MPEDVFGTDVSLYGSLEFFVEFLDKPEIKVRNTFIDRSFEMFCCNKIVYVFIYCNDPFVKGCPMLLTLISFLQIYPTQIIRVSIN